MMGSFVTRGLVLIFGYAYPAYECFKTVEKNKPEIQQLVFWCQYWILVALLTVFERVGDTFVSWLPMYNEAKLAFFIYLWCPKTKGTTYVYDSFFRPYVAKHEPEIDRNLLQLKTRAGDIALLYWQNAATYAQTRVFEILQYVASQSTSRPKGVETCRPPPTVRTRQEDATVQKPPQQPPQLPQQPQSRTSSTAPTLKHHASPSRTSRMNSTQQQQLPSCTSSAGTTPQQQETSLEKVSPSPASASAVQTEATAASKPVTQLSKPMQTDAEVTQIEESGSSLSNGNTNPPPQEMVMEDIIRVTRGRLRKNQGGSKG